ncbi:hypothetical protein MKQ68_17930 [Chitinophaga horti]|uniref:Lipocalin-like domain-containing protein n=1 Tax=Chitinophaga horti TaxID=2920382 RepID=A0ABY6IX59_9BACT|nr:hypothetical protein [Chitinophaga horti]UYQ91968.1 hypothetical protein MKQ68_17930 [Chitinophaga horti]
MKTKFVYVSLVALLGLTATSCKKSNSDSTVVLEDNLYKSAGKYAALIANRPPAPGSFEIETITRNGNTLTVTVKGACEAADLEAIWDGSVMLSDPGKINLVLSNKAKTNCADSQSTVNISLTKILGKHDPDNFIITVANGSARQDLSLNLDGSVSDN